MAFGKKGLTLPAHKFKSTAHPPLAKAKMPAAPKAPPKVGMATKGTFLPQTPMDKSAPKAPKMPKVVKPPAAKKPKLPTLPTY